MANKLASLLPKLTGKPDKYSKISALASLLKVIDGMDEVEALQLLAPLRFLAPHVPNIEKGLNDRMFAAVCTDDDLRYTGWRYLRYENGVAATCDGYRMHICRAALGVPDGFYSKESGKSPVHGLNELTFPPLTAVVESHGLRAGQQRYLCRLEELNRGVTIVGKSILQYTDLPTGQRVNTRYLYDAINGSCEFEYQTSDSAILVMQNKFTAVIMAMKVGK